MTRLGRRALLIGGGATVVAGGGLVVGFRLSRRGGGRVVKPGVFSPNQWLEIDRAGLVTVVNSVPEMGQGTSTSMAMIVADELDVDLSRVRLEQAPANPGLYANPVTKSQSYGGSRGVRDHLLTWRKAGAAAREMLKQAAADTWGVPLASVDTEPDAVVHRESGRRLAYGELVDRASKLAVPQDPPLKPRARFRYMGKPQPRLDVPSKISGRAVFGADVRVPGLLVATIARPPVVAGGKLRSVDDAEARRVPGVKAVVRVTSGVAVVAEHTWAALEGRRALRLEWDDGPLAALSSADIAKSYAAAAGQIGLTAKKTGDAPAALGAGGRPLEAVYEVPFLAHACMEPMNATAHVTATSCTVWAPTQDPGGAQATAARISGLSPEKVIVHTTQIGGGFGRRLLNDYVAEAVELSKAVGAPVKVLWTREDDIQHDYYRPATWNALKAALGADGRPTAWMHRIVGPGIGIQHGFTKRGAVDGSSVALAADLPYDIPNILVEWTEKDSGVPVGSWRSVGASQNAFVTESFVDELAYAARRDPFEYRRALLGSSPRHRAVLELAAARAGWSAPPPAGRARGIAVVLSYGSYAAHVAEVSVDRDGTPRVHRIVCAIDCGFAVNPDQVRAQMEGGAAFALGAVLHGEITFDRGRAQQSNFHDYPLLRISEMPVVEVHIVESAEPPGGLGEPGVPGVAPAVANAIYALTRRRVRKLPIRPADLRGWR
jgi:isoquinoline 1-oxidoreductase beta subunit